MSITCSYFLSKTSSVLPGWGRTWRRCHVYGVCSLESSCLHSYRRCSGPQRPSLSPGKRPSNSSSRPTYKDCPGGIEGSNVWSEAANYGFETRKMRVVITNELLFPKPTKYICLTLWLWRIKTLFSRTFFKIKTSRISCIDSFNLMLVTWHPSSHTVLLLTLWQLDQFRVNNVWVQNACVICCSAWYLLHFTHLFRSSKKASSQASIRCRWTSSMSN